MAEKISAKGKIDVAPAVISSIVSEAVLTCYGVVGTVPRNFAVGLVDKMSTDRKRGVEVIVRNGEIVIDIFVVIEYGTRISTVAHSIKHVVKYQVEKALELPVVEVNVHVQALRVSDLA
ncbi:MAG: Asp23/Gls24 family envelope stress response protein [Anaerolineae bacterium]|nr:Asp23/Gls24 family envelope stress response protein [Anaerolineae bacterium]